MFNIISFYVLLIILDPIQTLYLKNIFYQNQICNSGVSQKMWGKKAGERKSSCTGKTSHLTQQKINTLYTAILT